MWIFDQVILRAEFERLDGNDFTPRPTDKYNGDIQALDDDLLKRFQTTDAR